MWTGDARARLKNSDDAGLDPLDLPDSDAVYRGNHHHVRGFPFTRGLHHAVLVANGFEAFLIESPRYDLM
jgi:hypothetical protein